MDKLNDKDNQKHKDNKYQKSDLETFSINLKSSSDLQGWRNKLLYTIKETTVQNFINVCDFGSGLGDKAYLLSKLVKTDQVYCLDYSKIAIEKSKEFIKKDNFTFITSDANKSSDFIKKDSIDVGLMFGFLHEVRSVKEVLKNIFPLLKNSGLLIISDNDLTFNFKNLKNDLNDSGYKFKIFKVKKSFLTFHFGRFLFINYKKHSYRTDKLLAICSINSDQNIKFFIKSLKKIYS